MMVVIYYLEINKIKVLRFHRNNSSYFKIVLHPKASKLFKRWGCLVGETW